VRMPLAFISHSNGNGIQRIFKPFIGYDYSTLFAAVFFITYPISSYWIIPTTKYIIKKRHPDYAKLMSQYRHNAGSNALR